MEIKSKIDHSLTKQILSFIFLLLSLLFAYYLMAKNSQSSAKAYLENKQYEEKNITVESLIKRANNQLVFLSTCDDATTKLPKSTRQFFKDKQGDLLSQLGFRAAYVGVMKNGLMSEEKSAKEGVVVLEEGGVKLISAGLTAGNYSQLEINGEIIRTQNRGLNLFVLAENGAYLTVYSFDFFANKQPIAKIKRYPIKPLPSDDIEIIISQAVYQKFLKKKKEALKTQILLTSKDDFLPAEILYNQSAYKSEIRLKGDWTDHLIGDKWSFRVKLDKDNTINGMRKFSLHHPKTRNYVGEWLFHQLLKDAGILHLKYQFVRVKLVIQNSITKETKNLGIYALEEFFDKHLIEQNQRRAGVLLKIDEDPLWQERADFTAQHLDGKDLGYIKQFDYADAKILPFSESSVIKEEAIYQQFLTGRNLFKNYITNNAPISEVFDVSLLAKYNAICNLLGADHALLAHNYRVYFNPINALLEPVGFDGNAYHKIYYPYQYKGAEKDPTYMAAYAKAIEEVTTDDYVNSILNYPGLKEKNNLLYQSFPDFTWSEQILRHNQYTLKKMIHPTQALNVFFIEYSLNEIRVSVENHGKFPIEILALKDENGRKVGELAGEETIVKGNKNKYFTFRLKKDFQKLFVNKKKRKSSFDSKTDIEKIEVIYKTSGTLNEQSERILPWTNKGVNLSNIIPLKQKANVSQYSFLKIDEINKTINCQVGQWAVKTPIIIPAGYQFIINGNTQIDLQHPNASIISFSPIQFRGQKNHPIEIYSSTNIGGGLLVLNTQDTSFVENCKFTQLSNLATSAWSVSGAVNFYRAPVKISNSAFTKNRSEDALNIINGYFEIDNAVFRATKSDAFDGDFVKGRLTNSLFIDLGNDAIDVFGTNILVKNVAITNAGDKGLSAGENSEIKATNLIIKNSEIAVASKDKSTIEIDRSRIVDNKLAFTAFQKKSAFGVSKILADSISMENNAYDFLIEKGSSMQFNQRNIPTVPKVKERMYGIEFGKSSN